MPCHDGPPAPFTLFEAREQIDQLTRFMCEAVYLLERCKAESGALCVQVGVQNPNMTQHLSMPAQAWMRRHKAIDEQRSQIEKSFKAIRNGAMAKLSREEQMALGVGDWNMRTSE